MKIIRADHLGMCFGVRDAIDLALEMSRSEPLTILGDLVHNETVLGELRRRGISIVSQLVEAATPTVMITAHGASQKVIELASSQGHQVLEATCPLVQAAHRAVLKLVVEGFHPVIIGKRDHVEVRGLTGDLEAFDVVCSEEEVLKLHGQARFGVAAQTTQPIEKVRRLVEVLRHRFPASEVRFIDTVCRPTKQRQHAAVELAQRSDAVVVIGGEHSNNTRELVATCRGFCAHVYHVQTAEELQPAWFLGMETVGVTAGTSTPDSSIVAVENWLRKLATETNNGAGEALLSKHGESAPL
jgi:4-hydroxy-3-methylbut-2-enyl diphosphate reductase